MRVLHWFRADLRLRDNGSLAAAAANAAQIAFPFVLDERLLTSARGARPLLAQLAAGLERRGQRLIVRRGDPRTEVPRVAREVGADRVSWNRDTSPFARRRDAAVRSALARVRRPWEAPGLCPDCPPPIVDHAERRRLASERFEAARRA